MSFFTFSLRNRQDLKTRFLPRIQIRFSIMQRQSRSDGGDVAVENRNQLSFH